MNSLRTRVRFSPPPPYLPSGELSYVVDFIKYRVLPLRQDYPSYRYLYLDQRLSANSIALELGVSKQAVLSKLRKFGLVEKKRQSGFYKNGKSDRAPYGFYRLSDGEVIRFKPEILILRKIIFERDKCNRTFREIAVILKNEGFKTRRGKTTWQGSNVAKLYNYWKSKKQNGEVDSMGP